MKQFIIDWLRGYSNQDLLNAIRKSADDANALLSKKEKLSLADVGIYRYSFLLPHSEPSVTMLEMDDPTYPVLSVGKYALTKLDHKRMWIEKKIERPKEIKYGDKITHEDQKAEYLEPHIDVVFNHIK